MDAFKQDPFLTSGNVGPEGTRASQTLFSKGAPPPRGTRRGATTAGNTNARGMAFMIAVPWFMFSVLLCLYTFVFHQIKSVVYGALVAFAVVSVVFCFLDQMSRPGRVTHWYRKLGVLSGMATILAMICGSYTYEHHMALYWTYEENQKYTNVLPTEPAAAHADAGKIIFSDTARVDSTRSVGFKAGTVYCVAPILDDTQQSKVEYWAAGTDCCQQRADFSCDDAWDPKAKSGVVLIEPGGIFPSNQYFFSQSGDRS